MPKKGFLPKMATTTLLVFAQKPLAQIWLRIDYANEVRQNANQRFVCIASSGKSRSDLNGDGFLIANPEQSKFTEFTCSCKYLSVTLFEHKDRHNPNLVCFQFKADLFVFV